MKKDTLIYKKRSVNEAVGEEDSDQCFKSLEVRAYSGRAKEAVFCYDELTCIRFCKFASNGAGLIAEKTTQTIIIPGESGESEPLCIRWFQPCRTRLRSPKIYHGRCQDIHITIQCGGADS